MFHMACNYVYDKKMIRPMYKIGMHVLSNLDLPLWASYYYKE